MILSDSSSSFTCLKKEYPPIKHFKLFLLTFIHQAFKRLWTGMKCFNFAKEVVYFHPFFHVFISVTLLLSLFSLFITLPSLPSAAYLSSALTYYLPFKIYFLYLSTISLSPPYLFLSVSLLSLWHSCTCCITDSGRNLSSLPLFRCPVVPSDTLIALSHSRLPLLSNHSLSHSGIFSFPFYRIHSSELGAKLESM